MSHCPDDSGANPAAELLLSYEKTYLKAATLDDVLDRTAVLQGEPFVVSGLHDLRAVLFMVDELYRGHLQLDWRPLVRAGAAHGMWGEVDKQKRFHPPVRLATYVEQGKRDWRRGGPGDMVSQPLKLVVPVHHLWRASYLPKPGDQVRYRDTLYEISTASVDPAHYYQITGYPLYYSCEMVIANRNSTFDGCNMDFELEDGAPVQREPDGLSNSVGEPL